MSEPTWVADDCAEKYCEAPATIGQTVRWGDVRVEHYLCQEHFDAITEAAREADGLIEVHAPPPQITVTFGDGEGYVGGSYPLAADSTLHVERIPTGTSTVIIARDD